MNLVRYWLGRWRLRLGFCPACNSSPPRVTCTICWGSRVYGRHLLTPVEINSWRRRWDAVCRRS